MRFNQGKVEVSVIEGIVYPSVGMVISIHDVLISKFHNTEDPVHLGILHEGNLECDIWHIKDFVNEGESRDEKIIIKAAHLMHCLITSHAFVDGNKRIGFVMFLLFLRINNVKFNLDFSDYMPHARFIKKIADRGRKSRNVKLILNWYKKHNKV